MLLVVSNEVDPDATWHVEAIGEHLTDVRYYEYPTEEGEPDLTGVDGVVFSGSTVGVYETDAHPWIEAEQAFVRRLIKERIPTLGVCFGHQLVHAALGGEVEHRGLRAAVVEMDVIATDDPLLEGVGRAVPAVHGDVVTDPGTGLEPIAGTEDYPYFATRHVSAPVWTVQFHPEFTIALEDRLATAFGFDPGGHDFEACTHHRVYRNFERLVAEATPTGGR